MIIKFKKEQLLILAINIIALIAFILVFWSRHNYEFLMYVGVIIFFLIIIMFTINKVNYPTIVLWGLTAWSLLHMSGGGIYIGGKKIYELMIWSIVGNPYYIFRYDQFVHIVGFAVATLVIYYILKPILRIDLKKWTALSIVVIMAGLGVGALNEIIEFMATVIVPETGVGGYINTSLDLVADLIGAIGAMIYIKINNNKKNI